MTTWEVRIEYQHNVLPIFISRIHSTWDTEEQAFVQANSARKAHPDYKITIVERWDDE